MPPAREFYNSLDSDERNIVDGIIAEIRANPRVDMLLKIPFPVAPRIPIAYLDGRYFVIYDLENAYTVAIWDMGYDDPDTLIKPTPPDYR